MRLSKISRNTGIIFSLFVTVFLAYSSQILSQNKEHLIALKNCSARARFVDSLFHCHQYTDNEGEFTFWVYSFPDGEDVIFCQGNFVEFMEDDLVPKEVMTDGIKSTSWDYTTMGRYGALIDTATILQSTIAEFRRRKKTNMIQY